MVILKLKIFCHFEETDSRIIGAAVSHFYESKRVFSFFVFGFLHLLGNDFGFISSSCANKRVQVYFTAFFFFFRILVLVLSFFFFFSVPTSPPRRRRKLALFTLYSLLLENKAILYNNITNNLFQFFFLPLVVKLLYLYKTIYGV